MKKVTYVKPAEIIVGNLLAMCFFILIVYLILAFIFATFRVTEWTLNGQIVFAFMVIFLICYAIKRMLKIIAEYRDLGNIVNNKYESEEQR